MQRHFEKQLESLKSNLIRMASLAEAAIADAISAFLENELSLALRVIEKDPEINEMELAIDEAVVSILALQQPVAVDLRLILAAQKINNDLERIGDHAVNIAESARSCATRPPFEGPADIARMTGIVKKMLRDAIDAFVHMDAALARTVLLGDDTIDDLNRQVVKHLVGTMRNRPEEIDQALEFIRVSRNLERVADLTTNIAEEVIFMTEATVVKHHGADKPSPENDQ